jgi:predicted P-loop ATPase
MAKLGGPWFSDSLSFEDMKDKTAAEKIQGTWINEISELKGMRKMDIESVKSFVSRTEDRYRAAYGRRTDTHRRGCVFIGTSNAEDYLKDITGNRRFWPIKCSKNHKLNAWEMTPEDVAQIWAEVLFYYEDLDDRSLVLNKDMDAIATAKQVRALEQDERLGIVQLYLDKLLPTNWEEKDLSQRRFFFDNDEEGTETRDEVSVMEIWAECFKMSPAAKKRSDSDDIVRILLQLGWIRTEKTKRLRLYGPQAVFRRG